MVFLEVRDRSLEPSDNFRVDLGDPSRALGDRFELGDLIERDRASLERRSLNRYGFRSVDAGNRRLFGRDLRPSR